MAFHYLTGKPEQKELKNEPLKTGLFQLAAYRAVHSKDRGLSLALWSLSVKRALHGGAI